MARTDGKDRGIFERPRESGIWWIRYSDHLGQEHREKIGPKSLAKQVYQQRKTEIRLKKFDPEGIQRRKVWTVAKMLAHFREQRKVIGPKNQGEDQRYVDYWTERFGTYPVDQLKPTHLEEWRRERKADGVKPATINRPLTYLKAYFNLAIKENLCKDNPVEKLKALAENNERTRYLDPDDELPRLLEALGDEPRDIVEFALYTGLRQSEQFTISRGQVDLRAGCIKIAETKAGKPRFIHLNKVSRAIVERQIERYPNSPWLFPVPTHQENPRNAKNFKRRTFDVACQRAGISDLTWHDLRRSFASWLTMKGAHPQSLQNLLGHTSPRMTQRYSHLSPKNLQDTVSLLDG